VFLGKGEVFCAAINGGYAWLAALAAVNTVASLFYYLRWLIPAFLRQPAHSQSGQLHTVGLWPAASGYFAAAMSLTLGIAGGTGPAGLHRSAAAIAASWPVSRSCPARGVEADTAPRLRRYAVRCLPGSTGLS